MVRCGIFDPNDPPTPREPLLAVCPACDGRDDNCKACGGTGRYRIETDPREATPLIAFKVAQFAEMWTEHGIPLVAGGLLDQSNWFVSAASFCAADRDKNLADHYGET